MDEQLFRGYDRNLRLTHLEGAAVDTAVGRDDTPMIELKVYERQKRAVSAFLPPATAKALAEELLRAVARFDAP